MKVNMLSTVLNRMVRKFKLDFNLKYDVKSIGKLETLIDSALEKKKSDPDLSIGLTMVWAGFFGKSLVYSFEGKWIDEDNVQIFDGEIINLTKAIQDYVSKEKNRSLVNTYAEIHRRFFNTHNKKEDQKDKTLEEKRKETVNQFLNSLGLEGFVPIHSPEDFLEIEANKLKIRHLMAQLEKIYPDLKQLKEYRELRILPLSGDEAKQKIEEIKNIAAEKGDPAEMEILSYNYYSGEGLERDLEEAWFWNLKAAVKGHRGSMFNLGVFYLNGIGCTKDEEQGKYWLKKSADSGFEGAEEVLQRLAKGNYSGGSNKYFAWEIK